MIRAPYRRIPLWLRNNLSPTTSRRSTLKSKTVSIILWMGRKSIMRTFAGHIDNQIDIDVQITRGDMVHAKLEIRPAPNEFSSRRDEGNKEGEEAALARAGAMTSLGKASKLLRGVGAAASLLSQRAPRAGPCLRPSCGRRGSAKGRFRKKYTTWKPWPADVTWFTRS